MAYPHKVDEQGVVTEKNPDAGQPAEPPVEAPAVTGRPADDPTANSTFAERAKAARDGKPLKARMPEQSSNNSTFADRAKASRQKQVDSADVEDKAVKSQRTSKKAG